MENFSENISHQTLDEFIKSPFGNNIEQKALKYEDRYQSYKRANKIKVDATLVMDDNYFIHMKVPSESTKGDVVYDVVIQFFTPHDELRKGTVSLKKYYVQFFSNSPGFVYKYATLYRLNGFLIETLQDKFTEGALVILPDKANKDYELFYDSSIYYACRYIQDNPIKILGKLNFKIFRSKTPEAFFKDILSFDQISKVTDIAKLKIAFEKEIQHDTALSKSQEKKRSKKKNKSDTHRVKKIDSKKSTSKDGNFIKVVTGKGYTVAKSIKRINKKKGSFSTKKK